MKTLGLFIIVCLISLIAFIGLDYAYTALIHTPQIVHRDSVERSYRISDPKLHHTLKAGYDGPAYWGGKKYHFITNELGLRDGKKRSVPSDPGGRRLLVIGDSFTEGIGIEWKDTFVGLLATKDPDRHLLNAAVSSYSPSLYKAKIQWLWEKDIRFDEVYLFLDISDIQDECQLESDSRFSLNSSSEGQQAGSGPGNQQVAAPQTQMPLANFRDFLANNLRLTYMMAKIAKNLLKDGLGVEGLASLDAWQFEVRGGWTYLNPKTGYEPLGLEGCISKAQQRMDELFALLHKKRIPLTLAVYPWPHQIFAGDLDSRHVQIWRDWCDGKCNRFINLFPGFFEEAKRHGASWYKELFIVGDAHFKVEGHRLAHRLIEEAVNSP